MRTSAGCSDLLKKIRVTYTARIRKSDPELLVDFMKDAFNLVKTYVLTGEKKVSSITET